MSPMVKLPLTTEYALLGFLRQQPMHGYEIHRRLSESEGLGLVWHVKQNQLYALLGKLEDKGYVTIELEAQENRPARKVFHLTEAGHQAFLEWVQNPVKKAQKLRLDFLAKLYFARLEDAALTGKLIERQRAACQAWLATQHREAEETRQSRPYDWLVHKFRVGQLQAMLNWLDTCRQVLILAPEQPQREELDE